jgi:hypothetical protein
MAVHLYNAYQASNDAASLDRLLNAIDALRAGVDALFAKGNELKGWPRPMFPPTGHSADLLKLRLDGYQEPYKNSFLNWDTTAKRQAPLANPKRILAGPAKSRVTIDAPGWDLVQAQTLPPANPSTAEALGTQVRAMYDEGALYLRFDNALPPGATLDAIEKERVHVYLMPAAGSPVTFRFSAGLKPDSRTQAARGLIEDLMNLDYGKFDPLWRAEWTHIAIQDPKANRLIVMMTIPLKSIPPAAAKPGNVWYANFQRTNPAGAAAGAIYVWSAIEGGAGIEDPRGNGELSFVGDGGSAKSPAQVWREKYNQQTSEIPSAWTNLANLLPTPLGPWLFRPDPMEQGLKDGWQQAGAVETDWVLVKVPAMWGETAAVGDYQGDGWYRAKFTVPAEWKGKALRLLFCAVDEQCWIYVNGQLVKEHNVASEGKSINDLWETPFTAEVPAGQVKCGEVNVLAVRVNNAIGNGGIWRPVMVQAVGAKQ